MSPRLKIRPAGGLVTSGVDTVLPDAEPQRTVVGALPAGIGQDTHTELELVAAARDRLAAIRPEVVHPDLPRVVLAAAHAAHVCSDYSEARNDLRTTLDNLRAADRPDWHEIATVKAAADALASLETQLPASTLPRDVAINAVAYAIGVITTQRLEVTTPAYVAERHVWAQQPDHWRADVNRNAPAPTASDTSAVRALEALQRAAGPIASSIAAIQQNIGGDGVDMLSLIETASSVLDQQESLAERAAAVDAQIREANAARAVQGLTWTPPADWRPNVPPAPRSSLIGTR